MDDDLIPLVNMAFFYLKFRPRTIKEARDHLYKKLEQHTGRMVRLTRLLTI